MEALKIRYAAIIDGIQLGCKSSKGTHHGGTGGKEYIWNCCQGLSKIEIGVGEFKGTLVITGLSFCDGNGEWSDRLGKFGGHTEKV